MGHLHHLCDIAQKQCSIIRNANVNLCKKSVDFSPDTIESVARRHGIVIHELNVLPDHVDVVL